ncbi:MAG TPA: nuclear transport factor 2 family protein [Sphingomicrobium sp.]|nr:nuclear transport factor 2 family protein [Sphingomicrobium sp.]
MIRFVMSIGLAAALLAGCESEPPKADTKAVEQEILALEDQWNRALASRDSQAIAGLFADDAAIALPGKQLARGSDSIAKVAQSLAQDPNLNISLRPNRVQVAGSGDLAYTRGQYMLTASDEATNQPQSSRGYYLAVWQKRADGSWKLVENFLTPGPALAVTRRSAVIE